MRLSSNLAVWTVALAGVLAWPLPALPQSPAPRVVAIGDVHGAYDELVEILAAADLIDPALRWSGGASKLVILGDVLDRGARSRDALELVMALAEQAPQAGGSVDLVLGNHEVMNLLGDLAYVADAEFAAYAADESDAERAAALLRFTAGNAQGDAAAAVAAFEDRYPPGFFAHRAAFAPTGRLGAWLLERPVILTHDRTAFVHGGLPPAAVGKSVAEINRETRGALRDYLDAVGVLREAGALHVETDLRDHASLAARFVADNPSVIAARVLRAAERVSALPAALGGDSVLWYRGSVACSPAIERARLAAGLAALEADRLVIGHTPTPGGRVLARFDEMLIRADTGMLRAVYGGRATAVVIEGRRAVALDALTAETRAIETQLRAVGLTAGGGDDELERWLQEAPIVAAEPLPRGALRVQLETPAGSLAAVFRPTSRSNAGELPEVAAYRLDRLLALDIVPVAVGRTFDGRVGSLQLALDTLPTEGDRVRQRGVDAWCPLLDQFNSMYVLDALAGNDTRGPDSMRYRPEGWQLVLVGYEQSFGSRPDLPGYLRRAPIAVPAALAQRLRSLTEAELTASMSDVLGSERRAAILTRRDLLLAL